ncbi:MAG TPA: hypothetical protein VMU73_03835 [Gaiellaceae bacterium]|nr:hypothetical protein [Gaiellaceae bacterium]
MAGKKRVDPIKQREKRAKIAAGVGCLLFLVVAAIEVPSMLKMLNQKPPPSANATDAGNRNPNGSIPLPSVATGSQPVGKGELANTDVPPVASGDQLVAFSVFQTKNPFTPQATSAGSAATAATSPTTANKPGADVPPATTTPSSTAPSATTPTTTLSVVPGSAVPSTSTVATTTTAAPPTVAISVNGVVSHVGLQGTFPDGAPVFRLMSYTTTSVQIGIVGGSYASGGATLTLQVGKSVTLQNTTDQKTYKLKLIATH